MRKLSGEWNMLKRRTNGRNERTGTNNMEQKNLILVGGGGHCKSVIDVAESAGYNILGILDMPEDVGKKVLDYKVIGTDDDMPQYVDKAEFVITVGFIKIQPSESSYIIR